MKKGLSSKPTVGDFFLPSNCLRERLPTLPRWVPSSCCTWNEKSCNDRNPQITRALVSLALAIH